MRWVTGAPAVHEYEQVLGLGLLGFGVYAPKRATVAADLQAAIKLFSRNAKKGLNRPGMMEFLPP